MTCPEPLTVRIREIPHGRYEATATDPCEPGVFYRLDTFDKTRIHRILNQMQHERSLRGERESQGRREGRR